MKPIRILLPLLLIFCFAADAVANQSDEARRLYEEAQEALQRDRYRRAERQLQELLEKHPDDSMVGEAMYWRAFALYRIGEEDDDRRELREARELLQHVLEESDGRNGSRDARELMARIEGKLAQLGDRRAARDLSDRVDDDDDDLKMAALSALIHMDSDRALPILKKILANPQDYPEEMREQAIFLISQHADDEEAAQLLVQVAKGDESPELRENAIFWLSQVGSEEALDTLIEIMREEDDPDLQEKAVFAIGQHGSRRSAELLREVAIDENYDDDVRANAIFWLGQQSRTDFDFLDELYANVESNELKEKIIFAASQQGGQKQAEFLDQVLHDEDEDSELRGQALFWLGQSGMLDIAGLMKIYDSMEDDELREQALFAISQHGGSEATDALIHIVRTEKNPELRENALFWLGQLDDDRAADVLEEIIEGGGR